METLVPSFNHLSFLFRRVKNGFRYIKWWDSWLLGGLHSTLMLCTTDYWICDTLRWNTSKLLLDHGNWGHLRPYRDPRFSSAFCKWKGEKNSNRLNLIVFHWFIEHPLISTCFDAWAFARRSHLLYPCRFTPFNHKFTKPLLKFSSQA